MGVGGKIGSGKQWMSWIALDDVIGGIKFALANDSIKGPVNFVAPAPVTNAVFTKTLGKVLSRPTIFPIPAFGVRLLFGEMADALLLSSQRVESAVLQNSGYFFIVDVVPHVGLELPAAVSQNQREIQLAAFL